MRHVDPGNPLAFGLHAGYGWADTTITHDIGVPATNPTDSFNTKGWLLGAQLGLNVQVGSFVLGGEFSLSDASIKGSKANCAPVVFGPGTDTCRKEDDWLLLCPSSGALRQFEVFSKGGSGSVEVSA